MNALSKQVLATRKAHGLTVEKAGDYLHYEQTLPTMAKAMGFAPHVTHLNIVVHVGNELSKSLPISRSLVMVAFLDGYALAKHIDGKKRSKGQVLRAAAAVTRFVRAAGRSGPALLSGPHGETAKTLIEDFAPEGDEAALQGMANGFACGVLLYQYEHELVVPGFDALTPAKKAKAARPSDVEVALPKALLDGVLAAPDDDAPRLVASDWLAERGDPLGEFIQVQCALGRGRFGAGGKWVRSAKSTLPFETREELEAREQELLKLYEKRWVAPIRSAIRQWGFRRGFVNDVIADLSKFAAASGTTLARTPLEKAKLTGLQREQLAAIVKAPAHPTVDFIDLAANRIDDRVAPLLSAPLLSKVTKLNLEMNPLGRECLTALSTHRSLKRLLLSRLEVTDADFAQLTRAPFWKSLTGLFIGRCEHLSAGLAEAANAAPKLEWLSLPELSDDEVLAIAKAHPKLKYLSIVTTTVKDATVMKLLDLLPELTGFQAPHASSEKTKALVAQRLPGNRYVGFFD
ncbi:MAG: TIGR02996 domain-containing protein [Archangiaceae bacterium]|nr:TIGR02996 domain-containing protein [Archangiaceae bacterium]